MDKKHLTLLCAWGIFLVIGNGGAPGDGNSKG